jgi:hypothetical protein
VLAREEFHRLVAVPVGPYPPQPLATRGDPEVAATVVQQPPGGLKTIESVRAAVLSGAIKGSAGPW